MKFSEADRRAAVWELAVVDVFCWWSELDVTIRAACFQQIRSSATQIRVVELRCVGGPYRELPEAILSERKHASVCGALVSNKKNRFRF